MDQESIMKTGTTTVGIVCKDGLVLAADKKATAGYFIANKNVEKVITIKDKMALTTAGTVSDIQLMVKYLRAEVKLMELRTKRDMHVNEAASLLAGMVYANIRKFSVIPGISHFLFGGVDHTGSHLYDIYPDGSIQEIDDFVSSGSGSVFAYGLLETVYKKGLSTEDGVQLAIKCVNAAIQRDVASGEGVDVYVITEKGMQKVFSKQLQIKLEK
ncbi:proteasome subunit beta [Candidatus Woesearchaeota archaeon]|nr:proteasome subunit beta [Candidatus Woesearchaeota archaeon]